MSLALGELYFEVSGECTVELLISGSTRLSAADREDQGSRLVGRLVSIAPLELFGCSTSMDPATLEPFKPYTVEF